MQIIDRYLVRQFAKMLVICFLSLAGLYVVIDVFGNLEEFLDYAGREGSLLGVLVAYYGARLLSFFDLTSGLLTLVAAMFTMTLLERRNETTALLAAGVSRVRLVAPLAVAVVAVSMLAVANRELLIPQLRHRLTRNAQDLAGEASRRVHSTWDNRLGVFIDGESTDAQRRAIRQPQFLLPGGAHRWGRRLVADTAYYERANRDHPAGYRFENVQQPDRLGRLPSLVVDRTHVVYSPQDAAWLKPNECFVVSEVSFQQLLAGKSWHQFSSTAELIRTLHEDNDDYRAGVRVEVHARLVQPLLDVALLFLGLPLIASRENRNVFIATGLCIAIVLGFYVLVLGCHGLGASSLLLSPALAAWLPLIVLAPLAVVQGEKLTR